MLDEKADRWEYPNALGETEHHSAYIIIQGPGHDGTRLALREGITSFGRLPSNDVILLGDLVSRHHSRITFFEGKATLQDLGSHNGSWVNGERVTTRVLKPGDVARVGNFKLSFYEGPIGQADADAAGADAAFEETTAAEPRRSGAPLGGGDPPKMDTLLVARRARPKGHEPTTEPNGEPEVSIPGEPSGPSEHGKPGPSASGLQASSSVLIQQIERARGGHDAGGPSERALILLYRATEALAKAVNLKGYVQELLALILDQIRADYALFFRAVQPAADSGRAGDGRPEQKEPELLAARDKKGERTDPPLSLALVRWVVQKNFPVTTADASKDFRFEHDPSLLASPEPVHAVVCVPVASQKEVLGALYVSRPSPFTDADVDALGAIAHLSVVGLERAELREQALEEGLARELLSRFHAPDVVELLMKNTPPGKAPTPALDGKTATISFCDIQGFTALTERLTPQEMSDFFNVYLEQMTEITAKHRGTLERVSGASLMSIFGAPFSYGNDAARAVAAALEMRDAFDLLVRGHPNVGPRRLRIGINTGWVLAGTVGRPQRLEYTAIGDTVSAASRLEQSAAPGAILIGEATYPQTSDLFEVKKLGLQQIRGRVEPTQIFEVIGRKRATSRVK